jgi:hypothetical protein
MLAGKQITFMVEYMPITTAVTCLAGSASCNVFISSTYLLTLSAWPPFQNFSTPCILNVNNTGAKQGSIMK